MPNPGKYGPFGKINIPKKSATKPNTAPIYGPKSIAQSEVGTKLKLILKIWVSIAMNLVTTTCRPRSKAMVTNFFVVKSCFCIKITRSFLIGIFATKKEVLPSFFVAAECSYDTANIRRMFFVQRQLPVRLSLNASKPTLPNMNFSSISIIQFLFFVYTFLYKKRKILTK